MADKKLQLKIDRINEKKALYERRVAVARKQKRPDIESIWLNEIKVLDEKYAKLMAKKEVKPAAAPPPLPIAKKERKVRQLDNQIRYVKKKIEIHESRNEDVAVKKQTALLKKLEKQRETLIKEVANSDKKADEIASLMPTSKPTASTPAKPKPDPKKLSKADKKRLAEIDKEIDRADKLIEEYQKFHSPKAKQWIDKKNKLLAEQSKIRGGAGYFEEPSAHPQPVVTPPPAATHKPAVDNSKKIRALDADIAHANKMIKEYQRYNSPKLQQWVNKKNSLLAQRSKLAGGTGYQETRVSRNNADIASAQAINKQVRLIDLEIRHANRMINEYKKFNSPKSAQWVNRKNDLINRRNQLTHHKSAPAQDASIKKRIKVINLEVAHANKMISEYQKYNSPKAHEWIDKKNLLLVEKEQLEGNELFSTSGHRSSQNHTAQPTDRNAIKAQITALNQKAKDADTRMRTALKQGQHQQANNYHKKRDDYNKQVKQLTAVLSGASVATTVAAHSSSSSSGRSSSHSGSGRNSGRTSHSTRGSSGSASNFERDIAYKYLRTRNFTDEHAYAAIIDDLVSQSKFKHLNSAKATLYTIKSASHLPQKGSIINQPFIRDCFKVMTSGVHLENYTINDTIFNTGFPEAFDAMVNRINQHIGPAPELKHYKLLAHRDAIQLIPVDPSISKYHSQFAGAQLKDIVIKNVTIKSKGSLQGLFASDGSFKNVHFENISIETGSAHQIAILGMLSGTLALSAKNGKAMHVKLLPLRLGGGNNIYINSFSRSSSYQYGTVDSGNSSAIIHDDRRKMVKRGTYYQNFDMDVFFAALRRMGSRNIHQSIKDAAKQAGTVAKVISR